MNATDPAAPRGILGYTVRRRGRVIDVYQELPNLVMDVPRNLFARVLGEAGAAPAKVNRIGFGTSGAASTGSGPALTTPYIQALPAPSYPAVGEVRWDWVLQGSSAVGLSWLEMALICTDGSQFSRKNRTGAIVLDVDITVEGYWRILF